MNLRNLAHWHIFVFAVVPIQITQPPPSTVPEDGGPAMACVMIAGAGVLLERPIMIRLFTQDGTATGKSLSGE